MIMNREVSSNLVTSDLVRRLQDAAVAAARDTISGRRIIDVEGPYGTGLTTVEVGKDDITREPAPGEASAVVSRALSVPMIFRRFAISQRRIAAWQEMGQPLNLKAAEDAGQAVAEREEEFVYQGEADFHLGGLLTIAGRQTLKSANWSNIEGVMEDVITAVNMLDNKGYRGPYGLALAPELYNNLFRRYPDSDLLQIEHLKRLCTRGIVKAAIDGGVLVSREVGSIVIGQDLQIFHLNSDGAHEHFAASESIALKVEAPDAICTITGALVNRVAVPDDPR
jgi:uncharacterized linocin/CFP29 family protein